MMPPLCMLSSSNAAGCWPPLLAALPCHPCDRGQPAGSSPRKPAASAPAIAGSQEPAQGSRAARALAPLASAPPPAAGQASGEPSFPPRPPSPSHACSGHLGFRVYGLGFNTPLWLNLKVQDVGPIP